MAAGFEAVQWWIWPLALFLVCFVLGILAVPAGVGGGSGDPSRRSASTSST